MEHVYTQCQHKKLDSGSRRYNLSAVLENKGKKVWGLGK